MPFRPTRVQLAVTFSWFRQLAWITLQWDASKVTGERLSESQASAIELGPDGAENRGERLCKTGCKYTCEGTR